MGVASEPSGDLWKALAAEVERLTNGRTRGKSYSEDFAVDRVCSAIAKLRQQHERREADEQSAEEFRNLRVELAMEEQRLRIQQSRIEDARLQIREAREVKQELQQELESEEAGRREASNSQAKQWKEAAYRTHICLSNLRGKEQELAQLQAALARPESLAQVWDGLVRKLQSELDVANVEALEAKREADKLSLECSKAEQELSALNFGAPGIVDHGAAILSAAGATGPGMLRSALGATSFLRPGPKASDSVHHELLRIASRADDSAESLLKQFPAASGGGVASSAAGAARAQWSGMATLGGGASLRANSPGEQRSGNSILDEAQRVLEKMDRLHAWRSPSSASGGAVLFH